MRVDQNASGPEGAPSALLQLEEQGPNMRKLFWLGVAMTLMVGAYWSVAHATVHPRSPVGRALAWLGLEKKLPTPAPVASVEYSRCPGVAGCGEESSPPLLCVEAHEPAGLIVIEPDFRPMTDPDGNAVNVPVVVRSEPVREVVVSAEEFRLMPEVEALELTPIEQIREMPREKAPKGAITLGVSLGMKCSGCPLDAFVSLKVGERCEKMTLSGLVAALFEQKAGCCCPFAQGRKAACQDCPADCKDCPRCPAARPERIAEPPVEVEVSDPAQKGLSWLLAPFTRRSSFLDTMEMRPSDLTPSLSGTKKTY